MTRKEMEQRLKELIKQGGCYNDVTFNFAQMVLAEHLFIDPNSIEPSEAKSNPLNREPLFKRIYHDFGGNQRNDGRNKI